MSETTTKRGAFEITAAHHGGFIVLVPGDGRDRAYIHPVLYAGTLDECLAFVRDNIAPNGD